jgi:hypothetical protein
MWDPYQSSEDVEIDEHIVKNTGLSGERHATILALPPASTGKRYFEIIIVKNRGGIHIGNFASSNFPLRSDLVAGWMASSMNSKKPNFNIAIGDTSCMGLPLYNQTQSAD